MDKNETYRRREIYRQVCRVFSQRRNINPIKRKRLNRCVRVPQNGLNIEIGKEERNIKPALHCDSTYSETASRIGTFEFLYEVGDDKKLHKTGIKFVYYNGETFVSDDLSITYFLQNAGYRNLSLQFPKAI